MVKVRLPCQVFVTTYQLVFKGSKSTIARNVGRLGVVTITTDPALLKRKHTYKVFVYARDNNGKTLAKGSLVLGKY